MEARAHLGIGRRLSRTGSTPIPCTHENNADVVVAVGDLTGTTKWAHRYSTPVANHISTTSGDHAGTTLLVAGKHLISIGYAGYTHCFNTYTGEIVWSRNLAGDFPGTARPPRILPR